MKDQMIDYMNWENEVCKLIPLIYMCDYHKYFLEDERNDDLWSMFKVGLSPHEAVKAITKMIDGL